jgi:hypothetical protein
VIERLKPTGSRGHKSMPSGVISLETMQTVLRSSSAPLRIAHAGVARKKGFVVPARGLAYGSTSTEMARWSVSPG